MNRFQKESVVVCQRIWSASGMPGILEFLEMTGKKEHYLLAKTTVLEKQFSIVIYEDEAGISIERDPSARPRWFRMCSRKITFMFEKLDYPCPEAITDALSRKLSSMLSDMGRRSPDGNPP